MHVGLLLNSASSLPPASVPPGAKIFAALKATAASSRLHTLQLSHNHLSSATAKAAGLALAALGGQSGALRTLSLAYNEFGPADARALAGGLVPGVCSLETLDLSGNPLDGEGAATVLARVGGEDEAEAAAAGAAATAPEGGRGGIRKLSLGETRVMDKGAAAIAEILLRSGGGGGSALTHLSLSSNWQMGPDGALAIVRAAAKGRFGVELPPGGVTRRVSGRVQTLLGKRPLPPAARDAAEPSPAHKKGGANKVVEQQGEAPVAGAASTRAAAAPRRQQQLTIDLCEIDRLPSRRSRRCT